MNEDQNVYANRKINEDQYVYTNGKILVKTDKGMEMFPHFEGFDEIISCQNLVRKIKGKIESYKNQKQEVEERMFKEIVRTITFDGLYVVGIVFAATFSVILSIITSLIAVVYSSLGIVYYVEAKNKQKAINDALIYLEEQLVEAQNYLEELEQKEKEYTEPKQDFYLGNIPSIEEDMEYINDLKNLYYNCGYNHKKYILWYKLGLLREKLKEKYTEYDLDKIERFMATDAFNEKESMIRKLIIKAGKKRK